jgi:TldD protein
MVGDDFRLDRGVSFCHKKGQTLHVRVGQPTVRVDGLTISPGGA